MHLVKSPGQEFIKGDIQVDQSDLLVLVKSGARARDFGRRDDMRS